MRRSSRPERGREHKDRKNQCRRRYKSPETNPGIDRDTSVRITLRQRVRNSARPQRNYNSRLRRTRAKIHAEYNDEEPENQLKHGLASQPSVIRDHMSRITLHARSTSLLWRLNGYRRQPQRLRPRIERHEIRRPHLRKRIGLHLQLP